MRATRIVALAGLSTALLGTAQADIESSASVGYNTEYIYRGANLGEDLVSFSLGFSGKTDLADWDLGLWYGSWEGSVDELQVEASLSKCVNDSLTLKAGLLNHSNQNAVVIGGVAAFLDDRTEAVVGLSTNLGGIELSAAAHFNASDEYAHDVYYELGAKYTQELGASLTGNLGATVGVWDEDPLGTGADDVTFVAITGSLDYAASDSITLSAHITHSISDDWIFEDETFGGASVSVKF
ncbi:MAG: hypothetical protein CMP28_13880 [Roseibacillus sp.]|nr:hypothetical protein [Roseibacillus sp.]